MKEERKIIQYALISCWHVHKRMYVPKINESGFGRVVVVWDNDVERGKKWADEHNIAFEPNLEKILERDDIQAVLLECETTKRRELFEKCARAGKHILSDKMFDVEVEGCFRMKKVAEECHIKVGIMHEFLSMGAIRWIKALIDQGKLGKISSFYFRWVHDGMLPRADWIPDYWYDISQTGGGACFDLGIHGLYLMDYYCGRPERVSALMTWNKDFDKSATTTAVFESGAIGVSHTDFLSSYMDETLEIIGSEGIVLMTGTDTFEDTIEVRLQSNLIAGYENGLKPVAKEVYKKYELPSAPVAFTQFLQDEENHNMCMDEFSIERAVATLKLAQWSYESERTGKTVICKK